MDPSNPEHAEALALALKRLKRADAFESEIVGLLTRKGVSSPTADSVVDYLRSKGLVNDQRTAENLASHLQSRSRGVEKLRAELTKRGVSEELVQACLANEGPEQQRAAAVSLLEKRGESVTSRTKAGRLLHSRGFADEIVESVLDERFPVEDG